MSIFPIIRDMKCEDIITIPLIVTGSNGQWTPTRQNQICPYCTIQKCHIVLFKIPDLGMYAQMIYPPSNLHKSPFLVFHPPPYNRDRFKLLLEAWACSIIIELGYNPML